MANNTPHLGGGEGVWEGGLRTECNLSHSPLFSPMIFGTFPFFTFHFFSLSVLVESQKTNIQSFVQVETVAPRFYFFSVICKTELDPVKAHVT
jgi:hypothetical protein